MDVPRETPFSPYNVDMSVKNIADKTERRPTLTLIYVMWVKQVRSI